MPLHAADTADVAKLQISETETFVIFYSSRDKEGKLWRPDCVAVDDLVHEVFSPDDGPLGLIVYVGQRDEWKMASNLFRGEPWEVQTIPTIVRFRDSKEDMRLVDTEIADNLASFVKG